VFERESDGVFCDHSFTGGGVRGHKYTLMCLQVYNGLFLEHIRLKRPLKQVVRNDEITRNVYLIHKYPHQFMLYFKTMKNLDKGKSIWPPIPKLPTPKLVGDIKFHHKWSQHIMANQILFYQHTHVQLSLSATWATGQPQRPVSTVTSLLQVKAGMHISPY